MGSLHSTAQQNMELYTSAIPNSKPSSTEDIELIKDGEFFGHQNVSLPSLKIYLPETQLAKGAAVIICLGGGCKVQGSSFVHAYIALTVFDQ
jgi:hypothetical protein